MEAPVDGVLFQVHIPMLDKDPVAQGLQPSIKLLPHGNAAMHSPGAADSDGELALVLLKIIGNKVSHQFDGSL